jgi:hypothetical protein
MSYLGNKPLSTELGLLYTQQFNGDGVTVSFGLNDAPASISNIAVYIQGIYQQKSTFSLVGNNIVFTEAPVSGTANIEVVITEMVATTQLISGVNGAFVETDSLINQNHTVEVGKNAGSFGPVVINSGVVVTVPVGSVWTIV